MNYLGDFPEDATVYIPFNTFTSDDPSASATITNLADADIKVHKDGSVTQIVTDGATVAIDFDGITGNHLITIDTSAHADYSVGSDYMVRIEGTTVDAGTVNAWVGTFSIENRFKEVTVTSIGANVITATAINADAITAAKIADDALANEHFAAGALTATEITGAAGCAVSSIGANVVTAASIANAAIDAATFAADVDAEFRSYVGLASANLDTQIADLPTVAEFEARTILSADYVVVGDTLARVTLVDTTTDVTNQVTADATAISGSTAAADNLEASAETIIVDTVDTGYSETTTTLKGGGTATLSATDDHYNGRIIIFTSGTLQNQATDITDYDGTTKVFTVTAVTSAPADGVSFVIV